MLVYSLATERLEAPGVLGFVRGISSAHKFLAAERGDAITRSGQEAIVLSCRAWAGGPPTGLDDAPCHRHR